MREWLNAVPLPIQAYPGAGTRCRSPYARAPIGQKVVLIGLTHIRMPKPTAHIRFDTVVWLLNPLSHIDYHRHILRHDGRKQVEQLERRRHPLSGLVRGQDVPGYGDGRNCR